MVRAPCCEKIGLKKGPWTAEEDDILVSYIQRYGHGNWRALPKQAGLLRCGKSCRLRWTNYLRPDIKRGNFTTEEEEAIIILHEQLGNKWSAIAAALPGRTDNEIKNVWHTHLKKRVNPKSAGAAPEQAAKSVSSTSTTSSDIDGRRSSWDGEEADSEGSKPVKMEISRDPCPEVGVAPLQPQLNRELSCSGADSSSTTDFSSDQFVNIDPEFWYETFSMDATLPVVNASATLPEHDAKGVFALDFPLDPQRVSPADTSFMWYEDALSSYNYGDGCYGTALDRSTISNGTRNGQMDDMDFWKRVLLDAGKLSDMDLFSSDLPGYDG